MQPYPHRIRPNHNVDAPACHTAVYAAITRSMVPPRPNVVMAVAAVHHRWELGQFTRRHCFASDSPSKFWEWVSNLPTQRRSHWIWIYRAGTQLPALDFFHLMDQDLIRTPTFCGDSVPVVIRATAGKKKFTILDVRNCFNGPFEELPGTDYGDLAPMPTMAGTSGEWKTYAAERAEVISRSALAWVNWVKDADLGNVKPTCGSQAWHAWRHIDNCQIVHMHDCKPAKDMERESYYGGLTQCLYRGSVARNAIRLRTDPSHIASDRPHITGERLVHLDFSSFYPSIMARHLFPVKLIRYVKSPKDGLPDLDDERIGIVGDVVLDAHTNRYPVKSGGRTVYAKGKFATTLAGPEMEQAARDGELVNITRCSLYETGRPFQRFVDHMNGLRAKYKSEGADALEKVTKIVTNALYGKFAQMSRKWVERPLMNLGIRWGMVGWTNENCTEIRTLRVMAGKVEELIKSDTHPDSFTAISSYVTSYGRVHLWDAISSFPEKTVCYCDTDSLFVLESGYKEAKANGVPIGNGPGELRVCGIYDSAEFVSNRMYEIGGKYVHAGIPESARLVKDWTWKFDQHAEIQTAIGRGPDAGPLIVETERAATRDCDGCTYSPDGWLESEPNGYWLESGELF